jgi:hypothetical protein
MKYYFNFLTLSLISVSTVTLSLVNEKRVSARVPLRIAQKVLLNLLRLNSQKPFFNSLS